MSTSGPYYRCDLCGVSWPLTVDPGDQQCDCPIGFRSQPNPFVEGVDRSVDDRHLQTEHQVREVLRILEKGNIGDACELMKDTWVALEARLRNEENPRAPRDKLVRWAADYIGKVLRAFEGDPDPSEHEGKDLHMALLNFLQPIASVPWTPTRELYE
jgi:hypothetical protein